MTEKQAPRVVLSPTVEAGEEEGQLFKRVVGKEKHKDRETERGRELEGERGKGGRGEV